MPAIPLNETPAELFDAAKWAAFVAMVGNPAKAAERLSWLEHGVFQHYRKLSASLPGERGDSARRELAIFDAKEELIAGLVSDLTSGRLVMTALAPPSPERKNVPPDIVRDLHLDFVRSTAGSKDFQFVAVQIDRSAERQQDDIRQAVLAWLRSDPDFAVKPKKVLQHEAEQHIAPHLPKRVFDAAYRQAFSRSRGRPRKARAEKAQ